jgi:hypothetical protein
VLTTADCGVPPVAEILGPVAALAARTGINRRAHAAAPLLRVIAAIFTSNPPRRTFGSKYQGAFGRWEEG